MSGQTRADIGLERASIGLEGRTYRLGEGWFRPEESWSGQGRAGITLQTDGIGHCLKRADL